MSIVVGIQGGRGSFNEQAALAHIEGVGIGKFHLRYLHTTENVVSSLENGDIKFGQFAIHNTLGGDVEESKRAIQGYKFDVIARYKIQIGHVFMIAPNAELADIDTIMTHPQVIRQCRHKLQQSYGHIKLISGEGELIDPAKIAELIAHNELPKNIAVVSSGAIARANGLKIIAEKMQDADDNYTTFLLINNLSRDMSAQGQKEHILNIPLTGVANFNYDRVS